MSMPSDVTEDVTEASEAMSRPMAGPRSPDKLSNEQIGLIAAAAVAFLGVAFLGPALARLAKPKPPLQRARDAARDMRHRAEAAAKHARASARDARKHAEKKARRLGGGSLWH